MKIKNKKMLNEKGDLKWDYYFMSLAKLSALRSKDPTTRVGACIVNQQKYVVSLGYNGMPTNFQGDATIVDNDKIFPWERPQENGNVKDSKYAYVVHAEENAIINANITNSKIESGSIMYITHSPCFKCARLIVQSKIKKVIYAEAYRPESEEFEISEFILKSMGVEIEKMNINFDLSFEIKD
ncbi:dCMP deaminase family protein [Mycoplasma sp. 3341]|uniref:dCMP deaminase family protein n=1 Tax=Mycoplasma sp. 3341 TaxID=3447506 RepID=UPI003F65C154